MCGGVAFLDYDNDGWMDILLVNGCSRDKMKLGGCLLGRLYHNNHDGTFTDVTKKAGLTRRGWGMGVAVGDYDNDGWEDIYITSIGGAVLYHNDGNGTFTDATGKAGVGDASQWGTSAAFGDYDRDGFLDLYVANYVHIDWNNLPKFGSGPYCQYRGIPVSCGPRGLPGEKDRLYHNNRDGTFTDVTDKLRIDPDADYGLGVIWGDFDNDGEDDLYVADDSTPSLLYHNNGNGTFSEVGLESGVALSSDGKEQAGMGVDSCDYDNDGWPDLIKTNFSDDTNNLYHNESGRYFIDKANPLGFGRISVPFLGFGVKCFDYDNDGWKDILVANGHVNPQVDGYPIGISYAERKLLFHNLKGKGFEEVAASSGSALLEKKVSRGLAVGDFDNDGALDVLVSNLDDSPQLLRNVGGNRNHWIRIKTIGTRSNRDGFGARVQVTAGGLTQTDEVRANSSYLSASDPRLLFGLGRANEVDNIVVRWPSGIVDRVASETADQELMIEEGHGVIARVPPGHGEPRSNQPTDLNPRRVVPGIRP